MNRMAAFVSGRGSNLQALLDQEGCNIRLVCSHQLSVPADFKSKRYFIPVFKTKKIDFNQWKQVLLSQNIKRIFLLGFMRLISKEFVESWNAKIINLHPSLLPLFPGLNALEKSFQQKTVMGITIHQVVAEMDAGKTIVQSKVFSSEKILSDYKTASLLMTFREHYLVRRVGEKWN